MEELGGEGREEGGGEGVGAPFNVLPQGATDVVAPLLSRPSWLTYSGRFTHISGHPSAVGRAQDMHGKFAGQRPTFYHCTTQPTVHTFGAFMTA